MRIYKSKVILYTYYKTTKVSIDEVQCGKSGKSMAKDIRYRYQFYNNVLWIDNESAKEESRCRLQYCFGSEQVISRSRTSEANGIDNDSAFSSTNNSTSSICSTPKQILLNYSEYCRCMLHVVLNIC